MCSVSTCVNRANLAQSKPSFWLISPSGTCCNVHLDLGKVGGGRGKGEGGRGKEGWSAYGKNEISTVTRHMKETTRAVATYKNVSNTVYNTILTFCIYQHV